MAIAATLLIAPSIQHRLLFRLSEKAFLVDVGNKVAIVAMVFMTVGLTGILVLIADVVFGGASTVVVGVLAGLTVGRRVVRHPAQSPPPALGRNRPASAIAA